MVCLRECCFRRTFAPDKSAEVTNTNTSINPLKKERNFTRAELNKAGELAYTSLAESLRNAERPQPEPEPDGGDDDDDNNNG